MNTCSFFSSFLLVIAFQVISDAKPGFSQPTNYYGFKDSPLWDNSDSFFDSDWTIPKSPSFNTPFFTNPSPLSLSLYPKLSSSVPSSHLADFNKDNLYYPSSPSFGETTDVSKDAEDYYGKPKQTNTNTYNSFTTSHHVILHKYPSGSSMSLFSSPTFGSSSMSPYSSPSPSPSPNSVPSSTPPVDEDDKNHLVSDDENDSGPSASLKNAAALTGTAATVAAVTSALTKKPQQIQTQPSLEAAVPNSDKHQQPIQHEDKCNWCIRENCNPGGCQEAPNFNAQKDAEALHNALQGKNVNEKVVIDILTHRSEKQLKKIKQEYIVYESPLEAAILKTKNKDYLLEILQPRAMYIAEELHEALEKGDSKAMTLILASLSPCAIKKVNLAYTNKYGALDSLVKHIEGANVLNFEDFLVKLSKGNRQPDGPVKEDEAKKDVEALIKAGPKTLLFSDKSKFIDIFTQRSYSQLREITKIYNEKRKPKSNLKKDIIDNTSAKLQNGLLAVLENVNDQPGYFADEIEESMDKVLGSGVKDMDKLLHIIRSRCGIDLGDIRDTYSKKHGGKSLAEKLASKSDVKHIEVLNAMLRER